jgi:biopolymer transport protein TolQ
MNETTEAIANTAADLDAAATAATGSGDSLFSMLGQSGVLVTAVLVILVLLSVVSWGIIVAKARQLGRAASQSRAFVDAFWKSKELTDIYENREQFGGAPLAKVFAAGYREFRRALQLREGAAAMTGTLADALPGTDSIERAMRRTINAEVATMERLIPFLATTGSTGPFIGLFGTVWGIMSSFKDISQMKSASIAVVAPGISEALIATAAGLAAAIPAVMAYNYFVNRIRVIENEMHNFTADFLNIAAAQFGAAANPTRGASSARPRSGATPRLDPATEAQLEDRDDTFPGR